MVHAVYDHLVAVAVVGMIFVGAVVVLPAMSFGNLQAVDQQQLRNTALNVFNAMLLDTGEPANWGSLTDPRIQRFGLASAHDSTFYVLDPNKVRRLIDNSPYYVDPAEVRDLLGLTDCGFTLNIVCPFNVDYHVETKNVSDSSYIMKLHVNVFYRDGRPIPNAVIQATIVYLTEYEDEYGQIVFEVPMKIVEMTTDASGSCELAELLEASKGKVTPEVMVIFKVTVAGVASVVDIYRNDIPPEIAVINVVGDYVVVTMPQGSPSDVDISRGTRWIEEIYMYGQYGFVRLYTGEDGDKFTYFNEKDGLLPEGTKLWEREFKGLTNQDPFLLVFVMSVPNPRRNVLIVGPYTFGMESILVRYGELGGNVRVALQRSVIVSGMTYIAELVFWK